MKTSFYFATAYQSLSVKKDWWEVNYTKSQLKYARVSKSYSISMENVIAL